MRNIDIIRSKVLGPAELKSQLAVWRFKKKRIVFTNGCFDILHLGHIDYLARAADLGDVLMVGLNSDRSVSSIKGQHRPFIDQESRAMTLASLHFVNAVVLFDEDTPERLIGEVLPDVLVKGGDYSKEEIAGYDTVIKNDGEVIILDLVPGYSTSGIEKKIRSIL